MRLSDGCAKLIFQRCNFFGEGAGAIGQSQRSLAFASFETRKKARRRPHKPERRRAFLFRSYWTVCVPMINTGSAPIVT
jgi:hypothetical protein